MLIFNIPDWLQLFVWFSFASFATICSLWLLVFFAEYWAKKIWGDPYEGRIK
tara:strand:+ start:547 stop:702 length:156 start_codon:yes stop_codon:yes gene_type:complete